MAYTKPNSLIIMHNNFGPYHLARLNTVSKMGKKLGLEVVGLELASQEDIHPWRIDTLPLEVKKYAVFPHKAIEQVRPWSLVWGTWCILKKLNLQALALSLDRQTFPALLTVLAWAKLHRRVAILMMDSKYDDFPRRPWKEWAKRRVMSLFDAAIVAGERSKAYAEFLGIPPQRIFVGYDVVDNDYFSRQAAAVRENAAALRQQHQLPENYFLYVGRLTEKKNLGGLLEAYESYCKEAGPRAWTLVICGSGPLEEQLRQQARQLNLSQVIFAGFKQLDELPLYYGLARCLITPSSHSEQWGLVVNEAMASGLPVLVSQACGCVPELVDEGVNGYTFNPYDVEALSRLMAKLSSGALDLEAMGKASRQLVAPWSLETFSRNLFQAFEVGMTIKERPHN